VIVRERRAEDMAACIAALREVHERDAFPLTWPEDPAAWLTPREFLTAWVALRDGAIVGHIALSAIDEEDETPEAELKRLFVIPAARGAGSARALIDVALRECERLGRQPMLQVRDGERAAIALYERSGWKRVDSYRISWPGSKGEHIVHRYVRRRADG
jgi:GNAT superfamily N-acetyltransferase